MSSTHQNTPESGFTLFIPSLDCPTEEKIIREALADLPTQGLRFHLSTHELQVKAEASLKEEVIARLAAQGFSVEAPTQQPKRPYLRLGCAALFALAAELVHFTLAFPWLSAALALIAIALGGLSTYQAGWQALKQKQLNVNSLMTVAVTGAFLIGQWAEAAMVMVLFTLADHIEARTVDKARASISKLLSLAPAHALVLQENKWQTMAVGEIRPGMRIRVAPGERIALDGKVVEGHSTVDEAAFTGENLPVAKAPGDEVLAGTVNLTGSIVVQTSQASHQTALAKMTQLIEQAQEQQTPMARWIDQFASVYTPVVFALAIATVVLLPVFTQHTLLSAVYAALVLLVIACPCALVLAAPVTVSAGLTHGAREGILIKGGAYLEQGRRVSDLVFDKTGTLTLGLPKVIATQTEEASFIPLGGALAHHSQHPVSQAIAATHATDTLTFAQVQDHVGGGISGEFEGEAYFLGNLPWILSQLTLSADAKQQWQARTQAWEEKGCSVSLLANSQRILVLYALQDTLRPQAKDSITALRLGGKNLYILTGDNAHSAKQVAQAVGIDTALHRQTPEQKATFISQRQQEGKVVAMVGDGINDGLALAQANIGISLGQAGTDVAREAADVMLMDNSLSKLPYFFALSKRTHALVVQNISLAVGVKALVLVLALLGISHMWMAVLADVGVSLLVVANGLRALTLGSFRA